VALQDLPGAVAKVAVGGVDRDQDITVLDLPLVLLGLDLAGYPSALAWA
jgi:hypothetical protein